MQRIASDKGRSPGPNPARREAGARRAMTVMQLDRKPL
jgi:hypothetical protein